MCLTLKQQYFGCRVTAQTAVAMSTGEVEIRVSCVCQRGICAFGGCPWLSMCLSQPPIAIKARVITREHHQALCVYRYIYNMLIAHAPDAQTQVHVPLAIPTTVQTRRYDNTAAAVLRRTDLCHSCLNAVGGCYN